jgi:hypothetical protein
VTAVLPFSDPRRRSAHIGDLPSILAELTRLYELMRVDTEMKCHAYARSLAAHLKLVAEMMERSDLETRMRALEDRLGKTKPTPRGFSAEEWGNGRHTQ